MTHHLTLSTASCSPDPGPLPGSLVPAARLPGPSRPAPWSQPPGSLIPAAWLQLPGSLVPAPQLPGSQFPESTVTAAWLPCLPSSMVPLASYPSLGLGQTDWPYSLVTGTGQGPPPPPPCLESAPAAASSRHRDAAVPFSAATETDGEGGDRLDPAAGKFQGHAEHWKRLE